MSEDQTLSDERLDNLQSILEDNSHPNSIWATGITQAELLLLVKEVGTLRSDNRQQKGWIAMLEALRPFWAKGYSSDSVAAQASTGALSEIWRILGVSDQTQAMQKLRELVEVSEPEKSPAPGF